MRQLKIFSYLVFALFMLTACSMFHQHESAALYKSNVKNTRAISVPKGLDNADIDDYYPVPQLEKQAPNTPVSIIPPGSVLAKKG